MSDPVKIKNSTMRAVKGDITLLDVDAFVFYAREDLKLGSGVGTMVALRGGPSVQAELNKIGAIRTTEAVVSGAGELKVRYIVHAAGPKFQEEKSEEKLRETILNALRKADEKGISSIAFPPMGAGFYGVPLEKSAEITAKTVAQYLGNDTKIREVVLCGLDNRDFRALQEKLAALK